MKPLTLALLAFTTAVVADVLWGFYIRRVGGGHAAPAATYALLLQLIGAVQVLGYVERRWLILPLAAGNWCGTYLVTRYDGRRRLNPE